MSHGPGEFPNATNGQGEAVPSAVFGPSEGTVTSYDDHVGAGAVTGEDGRTWWFHCTRIADGTRSVEVGADVSYVLAPGPTGIEATKVQVAVQA